MSVHKDKKRNTWYVKINNKTKRGFKTKGEASKYERMLSIGVGETNEAKIDVDEKVIKYADATREYLDYCKDNLEYGTYAKTKSLFERIIIPIFGEKDLLTVSKKECLEFRRYVQNLDYATSYKNDILTRFKAVFTFARQFDIADNYSATVVTKIKKTHEEKVAKQEKEMNIWSVEEFNRFIKCVEGKKYQAFFIVLYFSGLRKGEALALLWKDYNGKELNINKAYTQKTKMGPYEIKDPKNESSIRKVILSDSVCNYLNSYHLEESEKYGYSDNWYIFGGFKPLTETSVARHKDDAIKLAGVRRIRIHDFRHSHASNLIADGVNIVAVSKRLGHADITTTLETYTHLMEKNNDEMLSKIEESSHNLLTNLLTGD